MLFETSNIQTVDHKKFIETNDQIRKGDMQWVRDSHDSYSKMMQDFTDYKTENNRLVSELSKQYSDDVLSMKGRLDQYAINARMMKDKVEVVSVGH